ncbi:MAG: isoprenyl transferase [Ruminococcaceae bacterium]|nr:isoprenyl transferase [Oscillospiraceae bacterium]
MVFSKLDKDNLPKHIAIIMDGNGRWAKKRGLPRTAGHYKGADNVRNIAHYCYDNGIKVLTLYAFSTENWKRPKPEVDALFKLFKEKLKDYRALMGNRDCVVRFIGDKTPLSDDIKKSMKEIEEYSSQFAHTGFTFNFAINYGSRDEIIKSVKDIALKVKNGEIEIDDIDEKMISDHLYTYGLPDPDLMVRPSGEQRISNFLLWQSAYTEFYYSDVLWPDFTPKMLEKAIIEYQQRNRRFGGV